MGPVAATLAGAYVDCLADPADQGHLRSSSVRAYRDEAAAAAAESPFERPVNGQHKVAVHAYPIRMQSRDRPT
jgi:hypothetical protein